MSLHPKTRRPSACAIVSAIRSALLDHRGGVPVRDPRQLVTAPIGVEIGLVIDLCEVQVEDVEAVVLRWRPEPDIGDPSAQPA